MRRRRSPEITGALVLIGLFAGSPHEAGVAWREARARPATRSPAQARETTRGAVRVHTIGSDQAARLLGGNWRAEGVPVVVVSAPQGDHGLRAGDVVLRIGNDPLESAEALDEAARRLAASGRDLPLLVGRSGKILPVSTRLPQRTANEPQELPEISPRGADRIEVRADDPAAVERLPPGLRPSVSSGPGNDPGSRSLPLFEAVDPASTGDDTESWEEVRRRFEDATVTGDPGNGPDVETAAEIEEVVRRYRSGTVEDGQGTLRRTRAANGSGFGAARRGRGGAGGGTVGARCTRVLMQGA